MKIRILRNQILSALPREQIRRLMGANKRTVGWVWQMTRLSLYLDTSLVIGMITIRCGCYFPQRYSVKNPKSFYLDRFQLNLLILLFVFAFFYRQPGLYLAFGFPASAYQPVLIGILLVSQFVLAPYNEILSVAISFVTRRFGMILVFL